MCKKRYLVKEHVDREIVGLEMMLIYNFNMEVIFKQLP